MSAWAATTAAGKGIPGCALSVSEPPDFCMEWNAEGQLKRVTLNGNDVARFSYDPRGRRVEKVAAGATTAYVYDRLDILRETRGAATLKYVHGPGVDEPLAREDGSGALTYYHADGLGSVVKRTSQAGTVAHEYRYDAWGNIEAGASEAGFAFTGREWDPEVGLYYYRARDYDPRIGRFISPDPLATLSGFNVFTYVNNDPIRYLDPSGLRRLTYNEVRQLVIDNNLSSQSDALIICVAYKESHFDTEARARGSSATGLMQVTVAAAKDAGFAHSDMTDPALNIQAGSKYLQNRIKLAKGDVRRGLELYGTGPGYGDDILECEACLNTCDESQDPEDCLRIIDQ